MLKKRSQPASFVLNTARQHLVDKREQMTTETKKFQKVKVSRLIDEIPPNSGCSKHASSMSEGSSSINNQHSGPNS
jgi:hypothetical protein